MKKTILLIGILIARISCFSEQQAIVTNANTNSVHGAEMAGSKGAGDDKIVPASGAMLRDYEQNPERWQNEQLFSIALGYVCETNIERAIASYNKFLSSQPNNVRAIRGLGNCYMMAQENDAAISQYKKGWALGDDLSLFGLANTYGILSKRYDDLKPLIPDLYKLRKRSGDVDIQREITHILIVFSLKGMPTPDKQMFLNSINGLSDGFILERDDTAELIIDSLEVFGEKDRANRLRDEITRRKESELSCKAGNSKSDAGDYAGAIDLTPKNWT